MATIAELAVNFTANTGGLDTGVSRATGALQRFKSEAEKASYSVDKEFGKLSQVFSSIGINGGALAGSISKIGLAVAGLGAGASLAVLINMFDNSVESAAKLQDMSEKTGASIEKLSGISQVAKIQGTDMDVVSAGMAKLAVNMEASGGASKKMSDALGRIGLTLADLKGKDTGTMFEMVSRKMSEYGDSAGKTAVAVELFGKKGAELSPTMNLLGESGDLVTKTTTEQAVAADAYEKNLQRLQLTKNALYKTISMEVLPSVNAFIKAMIEANNETDGVRAGAKELAADGSLKSWAETGALAVGYLIDTMQFLKRGMQETGLFIGALAAQIGLLAHGEVSAAAQVMREFTADVAKISGADYFTEKLQRQMAAKDEATGAKKTLTGGNTGSVANSSGDNFLQSLESRIKKGEQGEYAMLRLQAAEKGVLLSAEPLIEKLKAIDEARTAKSYEDSLARQNSDVEFQISLIGKTASEVEILNIAHKNTLELSKQISDAEKTKGALSTETITRMTEATETATRKQIQLIETRQSYERNWESGASRAMQNYADNATNYGKTAETAFTNGFRNMEDAIVQFATTGKLSFNSFANSVVADIMRIYARMVITGLVGKIAGAFAGNVSGTGYTSESPSGAGTYNYAGSQMTIGTVNALGNAFTGGKVTAFANGGIVSGPTLFPMANGAGLMGEAGPEAVMPLTRDSSGRLGVRAGGAGGNVQVTVINNGASDGYQATTQQSTDDNGKDIITVIIDKVKGAMSQDVRGNGQFTQLLANKFNLRGTM